MRCVPCSAWLLLLLLLVLATAAQQDFPEYGNHIIGGEAVDIKKVPYQVSIELKKSHICGGSVLSTQWVLSASHCLYGYTPAQLQVRAGTAKREQGGSVHAVRATALHPQYRSGHTDWDVAVIQLASPLTLGPIVQPVRLPAGGIEPSNNLPVVVSGWGYTTAQGPNMSSQLRMASLRVVSRSSCTASYPGQITARMMCSAAPGKDACTFDSGGPLVDQKGTQVGVVSWGKGCADSRYPGVYVNLGHGDVRSFIKKTAGL